MIKIDFHKHKYIYILIAIMLFAVGCRFIRYWECDQLERDTFNYLNMAESWASDGIIKAYMNETRGDPSVPPLLPAIMAAGKICGIGAINAGLWFNVICGALISLALYLSCIAIFKNRKYALMAAFLGAIHPYTLRLSALIMRDTPYIAAVMLALTCGIWGAQTRKLRYWLLFAIFTVLASLSRKEGPELILIFGCWCLWDLWRNRTEWKKQIFYLAKISVCVLAIFFTCTLPLQLYLKNNSDCTWSILNEDRLIDEYRKMTRGDLKKELKRSEKRIN